jgi:hypothetical protein
VVRDEWPVSFASGGYVALHHFDGKAVIMIAVRNGRETGWSFDLYD